MADKYTKKVAESPSPPSPPADAWKDVSVEKESQPPKVKHNMSYRQLENEKANQEAQKSACDSRIEEIVAEMAKVKSAVEA